MEDLPKHKSLLTQAEENRKGKRENKYAWAKYNKATTNEPKNIFPTTTTQKPITKSVYKYKLRIKQLLLKQVSNAMISYSSFWWFLFSSCYFFIGTFCTHF